MTCVRKMSITINWIYIWIVEVVLACQLVSTSLFKDNLFLISTKFHEFHHTLVLLIEFKVFNSLDMSQPKLLFINNTFFQINIDLRPMLRWNAAVLFDIDTTFIVQYKLSINRNMIGDIWPAINMLLL